MVGVAGLMFATLFAYISGAPFILQGCTACPRRQFGVAFSANAVGLILMTQLNPILVGRFGPVRVMSVAVLIAVTGALVLLVTTITGFGGLAGFLLPLALIVSAAGLSHAERPGHRPEPARRDGRRGRRRARRRPVHDRRGHLAPGRRARQRQRHRDGGDHGRAPPAWPPPCSGPPGGGCSAESGR